MTVLTKVKVSKKEDEPVLTQLVPGGDAEEGDQAPPAEDQVDAEAVRYRVLSQRARRINSSNLCALTALIAVISLCLLCGLFYYHRKSDRVHAWCSVPFESSTANDDLLLQQQQQPLFDQKPDWDSPRHREVEMKDLVTDHLHNMLSMFHEEFDIDQSENTAVLFVPEFERGRAARFMVHFRLGEMVVLPVDTPHCLTIELDREEFLEPRAMATQVRHMENGETLTAVTVTRKVVRVRGPQLTSDQLSPFVQRACAGRPTFAMERSLVFKRSVEDGDTTSMQFAVYGGRGLIQYTVKDLPPLQ